MQQRPQPAVRWRPSPSTRSRQARTSLAGSTPRQLPTAIPDGERLSSLAATFDAGSLVGVSAQGWLRSLDADGNVVRSHWAGAPFWHGAAAHSSMMFPQVGPS